ncbi:fibronectin type III domain protein, partial [Opisthorchis viverrini]
PSAPRNLRLNQLRRALPPGVKDPKAAFAVLELAWDPPERSHGDLRGYQVSHRLVGPPEAFSPASSDGDGGLAVEVKPPKPIRRNVTQTAYTSTISDGIQFGRVYQFEVAAFNGVDLGLPAQLNVTTPEEVPESYPLQVRLSGLSATAIEVTWSPPIQPQWEGGITSYQVRYFQPNSPNTTEVIRTTTEPRLVIEHLKERTFYTVMVRVLTNSGPGPWSMSSTIQTTAEQPPSQITGVRINLRQIKVTWDTFPVTPKSKRVPITGFRIYYAKNSNEVDLSTWKILDVGPVTMATLDVADPNSEYLVKIKSRGADGRYGRVSDPILVGTHVPEDTSQIGRGISGGDKGPGSNRAISHLSCHWIPGLETSKQGEASLKLYWRRPAQSEGLYQFQIQLLGIKSYSDETNQPRRVVFDPRILEVPLSMLIDSDSDPPVHVPAPIPVAAKQRTGQVVVRVFRVSESLGRIRRYYLILSKTSALIDFDSTPVAQELYWLSKLRDTQQSWDPDTFIAAEYSQEVFEESQMELLLSNPNYSRYRRTADKRVTLERNDSAATQSDAPNAIDPDVLVYGRQLIKDQEYKASL